VVNQTRRHALALLVAGLILALGTPAYLAYVDSGIRGYLLHPTLFLIQATPFGIAAVSWLPGWLKLPPTGVLLLSALLCLSAAILYLPMLTRLVPMGGDMVGIAFVATGLGTTLGVLTATAVAKVATALWQRRHPCTTTGSGHD
jgi:hypothetical protein